MEELCKLCGQAHSTGACTETTKPDQEDTIYEIGFEELAYGAEETIPVIDSFIMDEEETKKMRESLAPSPEKKEKAIQTLEAKGSKIRKEGNVYVIETHIQRYLKDATSISLGSVDAERVDLLRDIADLLMIDPEELQFRGSSNTNLQTILDTGVTQISSQEIHGTMQEEVVNNDQYPIWTDNHFIHASEYTSAPVQASERKILVDGAICVYDTDGLKRAVPRDQVKSKNNMHRRIFTKPPQEALRAVVYFHTPEESTPE